MPDIYKWEISDGLKIDNIFNSYSLSNISSLSFKLSDDKLPSSLNSESINNISSNEKENNEKINNYYFIDYFDEEIDYKQYKQYNYYENFYYLD